MFNRRQAMQTAAAVGGLALLGAPKPPQQLLMLGDYISGSPDCGFDEKILRMWSEASVRKIRRDLEFNEQFAA